MIVNRCAVDLRWQLSSLLGDAEEVEVLKHLSCEELEELFAELGEEPVSNVLCKWPKLQTPVLAEPMCGPNEYLNVCAWCGMSRVLPFDLRTNFVCEDAGFSCASQDGSEDEGDEGDLFSNVCSWCGEERLLPFDLGDGFVCRDVGLECDGLGFEGEHELHSNVCLSCGAARDLPFSLGDDFTCGDAGFECNERSYENVCTSCGETRMCPFILNDFVCDRCGGTAPKRFEEMDLPEAPAEEEPDDGLTTEEREAMRKENERTQLLWKTLIQALPMAQAAELFQAQGHEPPTEQELMDLRTNTLAHVRQKTIGRRQFMKSALKNKSSKGQTKRFLNNEMVSVAKKDKYLHTGGESAEDKAKTSVELYIIGIGRGGRHAVKVSMHEKKKGPVSNKHHK